jgi:hypothetical protein
MCSQDRLSAVGLHFPLLVELCSLVSSVFTFFAVFGFCFSFPCADLFCLYDALVQFHLILVGMEMHSFGTLGLLGGIHLL